LNSLRDWSLTSSRFADLNRTHPGQQHDDRSDLRESEVATLAGRRC
jgi:hypothetical protein